MTHWTTPPGDYTSIPDSGCTASQLAKILDLSVEDTGFLLRTWKKAGLVTYWNWYGYYKTTRKWYRMNDPYRAKAVQERRKC